MCGRLANTLLSVAAEASGAFCGCGYSFTPAVCGAPAQCVVALVNSRPHRQYGGTAKFPTAAATELFADTVREKILVWVARNVFKRENGERRPSGLAQSFAGEASIRLRGAPFVQ
jgi:hypothetical protein